MSDMEECNRIQKKRNGIIRLGGKNYYILIVIEGLFLVSKATNLGRKHRKYGFSCKTECNCYQP